MLVIGVAALAGGLAVVQPGPTLLALGVSAWLARRRVGWVALTLAVVLGGVSACRASGALVAAHEAIHTARGSVSPPKRCAVTFEVEASPVVLSPRHGQRAPGRRARLDVRVRHGTCGEELALLPPGLDVRLYGAPEHWFRGAVVDAVVDLGSIRLFDNPGSRHPLVGVALRRVAATGVVLDGEMVEAGRGVGASIDRWRAHVRSRIERTFATSVAGHARALVLGETDLEDAERDAFRVSGLAHLLAVSGTHLIVAVLALGALLRALLARLEPLARRCDVGRVSAAFCVLLAWLYADFAGGGGSAYRAAAMLSVVMLARVLGRRPSVTRGFAWSLLGGALVEPLAAHDLSFGLSVAATGGLLCWGRLPTPTEGRFSRLVASVVAAARATAVANLACLPLTLTINAEVPVLGVAANLLAAPVGELAALPVCLLHSLLWWAEPAEQGAALLGSGALEVVRAVAHAASESGVVVQVPPPTAWQLAVLALMTAGGWLRGARRGGRAVWLGLGFACLLGLELVARVDGAPSGVLRVTALDVGQGDAIVVDLPDGRLMLVDAGGLVGSPIDTGERVVLEVLRARRRSVIDVVVLSHPHPDHYGGLFTVLERLPVREIWTSGLGLATRPDGELSRALLGAVARGSVLRDATALCDKVHAFGAARIEVLGPCPSYDVSVSANDNSLVLRLQLGQHVALLTGDAEAHQEEQLLATHGERLRADLLKVGHHGSRTSSGERWLAAVRPRVGLISCGVRNRFGHPHEVTLETLERWQVTVLRTDRGGAATWQTDGSRQRWRRVRGGWRDMDSSP